MFKADVNCIVHCTQKKGSHPVGVRGRLAKKTGNRCPHRWRRGVIDTICTASYSGCIRSPTLQGCIFFNRAHVINACYAMLV